MNEDSISKAIETWAPGLDPRQARIALFEHVRDLRFRYPASRDPVDVLRTGGGSCSGKHYLLGALFSRLGVEHRHMMCSHRFNESPLPFPEEMQAILRKNEVVDVHDYLRICVDGTWLDVDCTWPKDLREFGFPVTEDWDGVSSMLLTVAPDEEHVIGGTDPTGVKDDLLAHLTPRQRTMRKTFLERLAAWVDDLSLEAAGPEG